MSKKTVLFKELRQLHSFITFLRIIMSGQQNPLIDNDDDLYFFFMESSTKTTVQVETVFNSSLFQFKTITFSPFIDLQTVYTSIFFFIYGFFFSAFVFNINKQLHNHNKNNLNNIKKKIIMKEKKNYIKVFNSTYIHHHIEVSLRSSGPNNRKQLLFIWKKYKKKTCDWLFIPKIYKPVV